MGLLEVKNLTFGYDNQIENVFDNISFKIDTNWKLGLIGRNGKGKTTLLNLFCGNYDYQGEITQNYLFDYFPFLIQDENLKTIDIIDNILDESKLPYTYTSYSPCFRKEKGAHGIEERGVYRIHQFEKQEMIVVCKPEDSKMWFDKLWNNTVDLFRSLDIPVRTLECCSGDLADLKAKSIDVEAWSPRQKKYFEVGSCSNLTDAQARRLNIRINGEKGKYFAHTLNNTVVAPPRMLIAFLENNLNEDGSVNIPVALRPYMGGKEKITTK